MNVGVFTKVCMIFFNTEAKVCMLFFSKKVNGCTPFKIFSFNKNVKKKRRNMIMIVSFGEQKVIKLIKLV